MNFLQMVALADRKIKLIYQYYNCIAWEDLSDRGNPCYKPTQFSSPQARAYDALWLAAVRAAMGYGSVLHRQLSTAVAQELGVAWVTYDWLAKALGRLCDSSYDELQEMLAKAYSIRNGTVLPN